jgi:YNFM family putative membrane transporter
MAPHVPISSGTPAYRRLSLALVIAGLATFSLLYSVQSLLPVFAKEFKVSAGEASLVVSLATGAMAITLLVASVISDSIGRQQMMAASLFAASVLTLVSAVLPGWHALLLTRFLTGIACAGIPAVAMAYIAEEVHGDSIGGAMGLYIGGAAIGGMAGRLLASVVSDLLGWRFAVAGDLYQRSMIGRRSWPVSGFFATMPRFPGCTPRASCSWAHS